MAVDRWITDNINVISSCKRIRAAQSSSCACPHEHAGKAPHERSNQTMCLMADIDGAVSSRGVTNEFRRLHSSNIAKLLQLSGASASGYIQELHKSTRPAGSSKKSLTIHKSAETREGAVTQPQCAPPRPDVVVDFFRSPSDQGPRRCH